jgi:ferric-dicitrate binding protein FerR (iron transport regulator)
VKDLIMTGPDGHAVLQVSDGSTFEVYPNSRVVFRKNPPNWKDFIDVLVGRVRIHIEHFGNVPNPNRVLTPTAVISVRGTTFDVSVDDDDETTLVEVEEGVVEVQHALLPRGDPKVLNTGDTLKVYRNEPLEASLIDKATVARQVMRSMVDAVTTIVTRMPHGLGSAGGVLGTGGAVGDTQKVPPPPSPPPVPPPPTKP